MRVAFPPGAGFDLPYLTLYPAVAFGAYYAGVIGGLLATLISLVAAAPALFPVNASPSDMVLSLAVFTTGGVLVSGLVGRLAEARHQAERRTAELTREAADRQIVEGNLVRLTEDLNRQLAERSARLAREQAARLEAQRRQHDARLTAELAWTVHESLEIDRMLPPLAATVRELTGVERVRLALLDPRSEQMRVRYPLEAAGAPDDLALPHQGIVARVVDTGRPFRSDDVTGELAADPLWRVSRETPRTALVVPIRIGTRVVGLVWAESHGPRDFSELEESVVLTVADHVGLAVRNAELLAGEQSARAAAEAANRAKDEFLAMLGHELRNPLGAIGNATRVLHEIGEQSSRLQAIIGRQTKHLGRLLDDLLDVSRLTMGKIVLHPEPVDLAEIVGHSLAAIEQEGKTTRHDIAVTTRPVIVHGDPARLEQVVRNLLDNAVKYTPAGGRIAVEVDREGDEAVLRVRDSGAGIPPDVLPRIFEQFVQGERSLERAKGGLGLGLTLVKRLVELHNGEVAAFSAGPDQGSEFVVRLPVLLEVPPAAAGTPAPAGTPRRIAIVEDNTDMREGLALLLRSWGHRVDEAGDGRAGLALILSARPDVALLDIGLPGMDGYEVARAVRRSPEGEGLLLVAISGYGQPEDVRRARAVGFDAHLVKPVDSDALQSLLARPTRSSR